MTYLSQLETSHRAMLATRAVARLGEQEQRRETRMRTHLAVGAVATLAFFALLPLVEDLAVYLTMVGAAGLAVGSFARAVDLRLGYTWGRLYRDPRRLTWFDRCVVRLVTPPRPEADAARVRVLPPD